MKQEVGDYLEDIVDAMDKAIEFVAEMSYDEFIQDDKTVFAVIRALEVIGEAVKNISQEYKRKYPEIPWKDMAGMRDKLIQEYHGVILHVVWGTVKEEIPPLQPVFEQLLRETQEEGLH